MAHAVSRDGLIVSPLFSEKKDAERWLLRRGTMSNDWSIQHGGYAYVESGREHSDRAMYVTRLVAEWLRNDETHAGRGRKVFELVGEYGLWDYVSAVLDGAKPDSPAWQVKQELAPNDAQRIRWCDVVDAIREEGEG